VLEDGENRQSTKMLRKNYFKQEAMYVYLTIVGRSRNPSCKGSPRVRSACIMDIHVAVTVNREKKIR